MKTLLYAFLILIASVLIIGFVFSDNSNDVDAGAATNHGAAYNNDAALAAIKAEPKVKDAYITDVGVLYASVIDDGTRRDGYASYLCQVLKDNNSSAKRVKVVKLGSSNDPNRDNAYGVLLGESWCN